MQAVKHFCGWHRLSVSRVKACDALCNLRVPSRFRARLWTGLDATEEAVGKGNPLVRRQNQGVVREGVECRRHGLRYDQKWKVSTLRRQASIHKRNQALRFLTVNAIAVAERSE